MRTIRRPCILGTGACRLRCKRTCVRNIAILFGEVNKNNAPRGSILPARSLRAAVEKRFMSIPF